MNYCIIMRYSSVENCYIVTVPDLPGCMADGQTPNEAFDNAKNVITEWIETQRQQVGRYQNHLLDRRIFKGRLLKAVPFLCVSSILLRENKIDYSSE